MANLNIALEHLTPNPAASTAPETLKPASPPEPPTGKIVEAHKFRVGQETGVPLREGENKTGEVLIRDSTTAQYETWLKTYLESIIKLKSDPALYDKVVNNPRHALDKELFSLLVVEERDGNFIDAKLDPEKFARFFEDPENLGVVDLLMQEQTLLKISALGVIADTMPLKERQALMLSLTVPLTGREDPISWRARLKTLVFGEPESKVRFQQSSKLLEVIAKPVVGNPAQSLQNKQEAEYIRAVTGINVDALVPVVSGGVHARVGETAIYGRSAKDLQNELLQTYNARKDLAHDVGAGDIDFLPEQNLIWRRYSQQPEQSGFQWGMEVEREFDVLRAGRGLGALGLDIQDRFQARRNVATRRLAHYARSVQREGTTEKKHSAVIALKETRTSDEARTKRAEEHTKRKEVRESDATALGSEKTTLTKYRDSITSFQGVLERTPAEREAKRKEVLAELRSPGVGGAAGTPFADTDAALVALNSVLDTDATSIVIGSRLILSTKERYENAEAARNAAFPTQVAGESSQAYQLRLNIEKANREEVFNRAKQRIDADAAEIDQMINEIKSVSGSESVVVPETLIDTNADVLAAAKNISQMQTEFASVIGWSGAGGVSLTEADLLGESFEELVKRINAANKADPTKGWSEEQNSLPEFRMKLVHVITEARARAIEPKIATPSNFFARLKGPWEITDNQLYTLTGEQILQLLTSRRAANPLHYAGAGAIPTKNRIEEARSDVRSQLDARCRAAEQMEQELNIQAKTEQIAAEAINLNQEKFTYELAAYTSEYQSEIMGKVSDIAFHVDTFTDVNLPSVDDVQYTKAERDAALPKAYYEFVNLIVDYRTNPSRDDYFKTMQTLLPPPELARILNDNLALGVAVPPSFDAVVREIGIQVASGTMKAYELRKPFYIIIDRLTDQALSIA